ncbi:MAG: DUF4292 domain-containing protein [Chloroherpetonaceae bacterium]|nr:DUF4292 domain-containing protein [Chloroherpetonaceae bacterium]
MIELALHLIFSKRLHLLFGLLAFFAILLFSACGEKESVKSEAERILIEKHVSNVIHTGRSLYSDSLYQTLRGKSLLIHSLSGEGTLAIRSPEMNQSVSCRVVLERGKAVQLLGSVMFGFTAFDMLLRPDSAFVYVPFQSSVFIGENKPENLRAVSGIDAEFESIINLFLGLPDPESALDSLTDVINTTGKIVYLFKNQGGAREEIVVDSASGTLESIARSDSIKGIFTGVFFSRFQSEILGEGTVTLPKEITFLSRALADSLGNERRLTFQYQKRNLNPAEIRFTFKMPKKAKVYLLNQMIQQPNETGHK